MNLHQLGVFRAILETGSFSKAALELRIAQSAVSYHVKMLEEEIGQPLFTRMKGRALPTDKGQQLWKHAERIFATVAEAERELRLPVDSQWSDLHFGLGVSSLTPQLPRLLKALREIYPAIIFHLVMGSTPQIVEHLRAGRADMGVVSLPVLDDDITTTPLFYEQGQMHVVVPVGSTLAGRTEITVDMLEGLPLILYNKSTATRATLDKFFRDASLDPYVFMEIDREDTIMSMVKSVPGVTILPECVLQNAMEDEDVRCIPLRNAWLRREIGIALIRGAGPSRVVDVAVRLCRDHFRPA
jgi:DNA-binding transcriptional LysR family regulator